MLCAFLFSLCACGKESKDPAAVYEKTIAGLQDNELFVMIDTNASYTMTTGNETKTISEEDYYTAFEKYSNAVVVGFAYGASDGRNDS